LGLSAVNNKLSKTEKHHQRKTRSKNASGKERKMSAKMSIIRELFYGRVKPVDQSFFQSTEEFQEAQKAFWLYRAKMHAVLNEEDRKLFDEFNETIQKFETISNGENFANGFSLGLRISFESMGQLRYIDKI